MVQANILKLERQAEELGAYRAKAFSARQVIVDERVRAKCQIPLCPHYGRCLTCPPNLPTVAEFRKTLERYETALLMQMRSTISGEIGKADREAVLQFVAARGKPAGKKGQQVEALHDLDQMNIAAIRLHKLVNEVERTAMSLGFPYALGLIGGECMLCPECVGIGSGKACRRPYEARPSMEGVGIDVYQTCINAGLPFAMPPKTEIIWSGLILLD